MVDSRQTRDRSGPSAPGPSRTARSGPSGPGPGQSGLPVPGPGTAAERYYGYIPDLLHAIAAILDWRFELYVVPHGEGDTGYGHKTLDGNWDGMIGELLNGVSDRGTNEGTDEDTDGGTDEIGRAHV